ncbi:hypothetical protein [Phaeodactylibacter xiamenensis]|uniref:hypothetical protein n=1 Tax=Phaeodactylibacter xiamenensis TaxID=1524460 RepID=UPI0024A99907|nr:hypothetical protein [Phaeodactylibacter xiamenensis]
MKNFALTLLLTVLTFHLATAAVHCPADTLKCDTLVLKNGIETHARIVGVSGNSFIVQYCDEDRKTHIHSADLEAIRFSDGTQFGKPEIKQEIRLKRRGAKALTPKRIKSTGKLQLLGAFLAAPVAAFSILAFVVSGASVVLVISISLTVLVIYLLFRGISNLILAGRLRKKLKKQESSF